MLCIRSSSQIHFITSGNVSFTDESSKDDEPEASTQEQHEIDWACTWTEAEGVPALGEDEAQGLLIQVFPFAF